MENLIVDQKIKLKESKVSNECPREFKKIDGETLKKLVFMNDVPGLEGLNRKVKIDSRMRSYVNKLKNNPRLFLYERRPILVNKRNLMILDGQHTATAGLIFLREYPELSEEFECYIELWDISTISEEERIVRNLNADAKNWSGYDYLNQGLKSFEPGKRENYGRFLEIMDYLESKEGSNGRFNKKSIISKAGSCIGITSVGQHLSSKYNHKLTITSGQVGDAKTIIDLAYELEEAARGPIEVNGVQKFNKNFTLECSKVFSVLYKLNRLQSFNRDKLIDYVKNNCETLEWWGGETTTSLKRLTNCILDVAKDASAISEEDYSETYRY